MHAGCGCCLNRYTLTMNTSLDSEAPPDRAAIGELISQHVPDALHLRSSGAELARLIAPSSHRCL